MITLNINFTGNKASMLAALLFIILPLWGYRIWRRQIQRKVCVFRKTFVVLLTYKRKKINMRRKWDAKHHGGGQQNGRKAWICSSKQGNTQDPRLSCNFSWT